MAETFDRRSLLRSQLAHPPAQAGQVKGRGDQMRRLIARLERIAKGEIPALIQGETGTGKELCAQAIHKLSTRRSAPLITVNCASIPSALLTAELFGSERSAYTDAADRKGLIASAHLGTLFLDEVGELSLEAQAALLRVLETGELRKLGSDRVRRVNIRLICATHRDLGEMVKRGTFRADLYHRIAVGVLQIPPLRDRQDDLPFIVSELSEKVASRLSASAWSTLSEYAWPGNVRELKNVIRCAELEYPQGIINDHHLQIPSEGPWRLCSLNESANQVSDLPTPFFAKRRITSSLLRAANDDQVKVSGAIELIDQGNEGTSIFNPSGDKFLVTGEPLINKSPSPHGGGDPSPLSSALMKPSDDLESSLDTLLRRIPTLSLEEVKKAYVQCQYEKLGENISETSRLLKLSRGTVYRLLDRQKQAA